MPNADVKTDPALKRLSPEQVQRYHEDGILFPLDALSQDEAASSLRALEAVEAANGGRLSGRLGQKPHLLYPWANRMVRHPAILDAVQDILGPNLLC